MSLRKGQAPSVKMSRFQPRVPGPVPLMMAEGFAFPDDDDDDFNAARYLMLATHEHLRNKVAKLQANAVRLKRELRLLQRHVKEFDHPLYETWEADVLTRLIEVVYARKYRKLPAGVAIGETTTAEREALSRAYSAAAKRIRVDTIMKLGLSDRHHEALLRYDEIATYRSPNPFSTEIQFARWLVDRREKKPQMYEFWSKLFPVCYDRTVEESATNF